MENLISCLGWVRDAWDSIGDNAANIIALASAAFVAYQAWLTRIHNRLSVRPHLQTHTSTHTELGHLPTLSYVYELRNNGLGPAVIKDWTVFLDGVKQVLPTGKVVDQLIRGLIPNPLQITTRFIGQDEVIRANDSQVLLAIRLPPLNGEQLKAFEEQLNRLDLVVNYTSMYGEKVQPLDTRE